jgi:uncharacterized coiled-coil protein SlyX
VDPSIRAAAITNNNMKPAPITVVDQLAYLRNQAAFKKAANSTDRQTANIVALEVVDVYNEIATQPTCKTAAVLLVTDDAQRQQQFAVLVGEIEKRLEEISTRANSAVSSLEADLAQKDEELRRLSANLQSKTNALEDINEKIGAQVVKMGEVAVGVSKLQGSGPLRMELDKIQAALSNLVKGP